MARKPGGLTTTEGWQKANFPLRPETKLALGHAALNRKQTMGETADELLDAALNQEWVRLPVLGRVGAGNSVICEEFVEEWISLPAEMARGADFILRARGDSMSPTINDGDQVLVHIQPTAEIHQVVVVRQDSEAVIKRLRSTNGTVELCSDNPAYPPLRLPRGEIVGRAIRFMRDL